MGADVGDGWVVILLAVGVLVVVAVVTVLGVRSTRRHDAAVLRAELTATHRDELDRAVSHLADVAGERLDARIRTSAGDLQTRKELIDAELAAVRRSLEQVTGLVGDLEQRRAGQLGQVSEQLGGVARAQSQLADVAGALRTALTSSQARGQWGERLVHDVLRAAGFVEGASYVTQRTLPGGGRPDVTFLLPDDRVLHLDVKFPFANYLAMLEAESDERREVLRTAFLRDVRGRVRELPRRGYLDPSAGTLDCVLLFIPNEAVAAYLFEQDPTVIDDALAQGVVLTSPATLFAVLAVVRHTADRLALAETGDEILTALAGFRDQWERTVEVVDRLGRGLETTRRAFEELNGVRDQQLRRHLDRIDELRQGRGVADLAADGEPGDGDGAGAGADARADADADAGGRRA